MSKKTTALQKPMTKNELLADIAETTGLSKKDVSSVLDELSGIIHRHIRKRSVGTFIFPGLFKIVTAKKAAVKAQKNVPNPLRPGQFYDIAAKPASTTVKVRALKGLKEMALN